MFRFFQVVLAGRRPHKEAGQHRLANVQGIEEPAELSVGQTKANGAPDRRLVVLHQFRGRGQQRQHGRERGQRQPIGKSLDVQVDRGQGDSRHPKHAERRDLRCACEASGERADGDGARQLK